MNDLTIYNYTGAIADSQHEFITIKGVNLDDILHEYSIEQIVDALCATGKDADVIDGLAKRSEEE